MPTIKNEGFICCHCNKIINIDKIPGTKNRNHCPFCLWSKHVDEKLPGDRQAICLGNMKPLALTFKKKGLDRFEKNIFEEIMLVHLCEKCGKININRVAGDDDPNVIINILESSTQNVIGLEKDLNKLEIEIIPIDQKEIVSSQLFGK